MGGGSFLGALVALAILVAIKYDDHKQQQQARELQLQQLQALNAEQIWRDLQERVVVPSMREFLGGDAVHREQVEPCPVACGYGFECLFPPEKLEKAEDAKVFERKLERKFEKYSGISHEEVRKRHLVQVHGTVVSIAFPM